MTTETLTKEQIQARIKELEKERDTYVERLDNGAALIETKKAQRENVDALEEFWIELLREYEKVCDTLRELNRLID